MKWYLLVEMVKRLKRMLEALLIVKCVLFIKCIVLYELYRSLLGAYVQQAT